VETQIDIQTYLEQGKKHLAQGEAREAAIAYAHGAQLEPNNPQVHLGLAEANLALGNYSVVQMACGRVQELQPDGGDESLLARALLNLLAQNYERALHDVDTLIGHDPSIAYVHALRFHLLRALGQGYDANLARARATRLSFGGRFENCFPPLPVGNLVGSNGAATQSGQSVGAADNGAQGNPDPVSPWTDRSKLQRQMIRTRFALSQHPGFLTKILIAINVIVYLIVAVGARSLVDMNAETIYFAGGQNTPLMQMTGEYWRIFTSMFLHFSLIHLGLNMLSLFIIGRVVEVLYGTWRYLLIYLGSGIIGGITAYFFSSPEAVSAGASGAIFGVFGALGIFYLMNRRSSNAIGRGAISNWLFWLGLNLIWGLSVPGIAIADHIGGLIGGMLLSFLLIPHARWRKI
jgi:membrane associated rhomboid family serine protease